jgi:hypothetical protein
MSLINLVSLVRLNTECAVAVFKCARSSESRQALTQGFHNKDIFVSAEYSTYYQVLRIRSRIRTVMFSGLLDPNPLVRGSVADPLHFSTDPDSGTHASD